MKPFVSMWLRRDAGELEPDERAVAVSDVLAACPDDAVTLRRVVQLAGEQGQGSGAVVALVREVDGAGTLAGVRGPRRDGGAACWRFGPGGDTVWWVPRDVTGLVVRPLPPALDLGPAPAPPPAPAVPAAAAVAAPRGGLLDAAGLAALGETATEADYGRVRSGRDAYSAMKLPELLAAPDAPAVVAALEARGLTGDELVARALRWARRGLDADMAAETVRVQEQLARARSGR